MSRVTKEAATTAQTSSSLDTMGFSAPLQAKAMSFASSLQDALEATDYDSLLTNVKGLRTVPICSIPQPRPILVSLLEWFSSPNAIDLDMTGFKNLISEEANRFAMGLFLANRRDSKPQLYSKEIKKQILAMIDEALESVDEQSQPCGVLRYNLECTRASVLQLSDGQSWVDYGKEEGKELLLACLEGAIDGGTGVRTALCFCLASAATLILVCQRKEALPAVLPPSR